MNAPAKALPADGVLDALAEALAPRVLRLLRERAAGVTEDAAIDALLDELGFEREDGAT